MAEITARDGTRPLVLVADRSGLVRRIAREALERAGFHVVVAADLAEALAAARTSAPDALVVDRAVAGDELGALVTVAGEVRGGRVPAVLALTGGGGSDDDAEALTKPFEPEALVEAVAARLTRRPTQEPGDWADRLAARLAPALVEPLPHPSTRALAVRLRERCAPADIVAACEPLLRSGWGLGVAVSLAGRLDQVAVAEVLQLLDLQRQTGLLELEGERRTARLWLREGRLDAADLSPSGREHRLGRHLVATGAIGEDELEEVAERLGSSPHGLGAQLVRLGYLAEDELRAALGRQAGAVVFDVLRWSTGSFRFVKHGAPPARLGARLALPLAPLLLEGLRKLDEWKLIRQRIPSLDAVPSRVRAAGALGREAPRDVARLLEAVDGHRSLEELRRALGWTDFEACQALYDLVTRGQVRAVVPASAP